MTEIQTKKLTVELMCIKMRSGAEIWVEKSKAQKLIDLLGATESKFVDIDGEMINSASVEGVFSAQTIEELTRRKNGQWKDTKGIWQNRGSIECKCGTILPFGSKCGICRN